MKLLEGMSFQKSTAWRFCDDDDLFFTGQLAISQESFIASASFQSSPE